MNKLVIAIMWNDELSLKKVMELLKEKYGDILKESEEFDFTKYTSYYNKEMGENIKKKFLIFNYEVKDLAKIKKITSEIEKKFSENNKRKVNIDPGYLNERELVLASFKEKHFKEKIAKDIYSHKVLEFNNGIKTFYHTFKDYEDYKNFFYENRNLR